MDTSTHQPYYSVQAFLQLAFDEGLAVVFQDDQHGAGRCRYQACFEIGHYLSLLDACDTPRVLASGRERGILSGSGRCLGPRNLPFP